MTAPFEFDNHFHLVDIAIDGWMRMKAREGDMIEADGAIFDVKGLIHPLGKVVASLHYLLDSRGDRKRGKVSYNRISSFSQRQRLIEENFPQYLVFDPVFGKRLCELPFEAIKCHHKPADYLRELRRRKGLDEVERQALSFVELLKESSNVPWRAFGISGSILVGLHFSGSDIDPIVYGSKNCRRVYAVLKELQVYPMSSVKPYDIDGLRRLHEFRSDDTHMLFEDFIRTESRKVLQGEFSGREYSIKFVKDWDEIVDEYGSTRYSSIGYAKIKAKVADDSDAIFTPCRYRIEDTKNLECTRVGPIEEITSFRMRFCEQARNGENVVAQGKVERVQMGKGESYRLMIGNRPSDFMILAN